ncbi:MAG: hypothetical protein E6G96_01555 [Alphaproteobacteria bacterium]|nr:MAG: hypothetical protein E6G96_01555 [Alphaproteobacteria bacterium]
MSLSASAATESAGAASHQPWNKLAALVLIIAALGLPLNDLFRYALLIVSCVAISFGRLSRDRRVWVGAVLAVAACVLAQVLLAAPRIEEGHNVFLIDAPGGALEAGLPAAAFQLMAKEFNATYPPPRRCDPRIAGCWRGDGFPRQPYAFSSDGIYDRAPQSRRVTSIDFADPVWLRLGFINERSYNWNSRVSEIERAARDPRFWALFHRWRLGMPWFVMYRFPAEFVGSSLCWRGEVLWERADERFDPTTHSDMQCRVLDAQDVGRRIFGVAIAQAPPLAMRLAPNSRIKLAQLIEPALVLAAVAAVLGLLVRWRVRAGLLAFGAVALTLLVVVLNDASFVGGVRPFDAGDDGLVYDGFARDMLRQIVTGNFAGALEGGEKVFYFTPGLRYLRVVEHLIFGETYLGYLLVFALFRRFLPPDWAIAMMLIFAAVPVGMLFGSSLVQYVKWSARGFADPAAYVLFLAGLILLVGRGSDGPRVTFATACGAGFLFALALFVRPNIAPAAAILLAGSAIAALWQRQYRRVAGLCIGFLPVLGMALHNEIYGGELVLFTASATHPGTLVMPPSAYVAALGELVRLDLTGEQVGRALRQIGGWLAGPSESYVMVPLNAAAIAVLLRVVAWNQIDPWLRLIAWASLAQHCVGLFYATAGRYHYLTWLLTLLVTTVWAHREGLELVRRRYPAFALAIANNPTRRALALWLHKLAC